MAKRKGSRSGGGSAAPSGAELWSGDGLLPPPALLAEYEELHPGFAALFLESWAAEGEHRRSMEARVVDGQVTAHLRAQPLALSLGAAGLFAATMIAIDGSPAAGVATVVIVFGAFLLALALGGRQADAEVTAGSRDVAPTRSTPVVSSEPKARPPKARQPNRSKKKKRRR